jgi:hypothetical protein
MTKADRDSLLQLCRMRARVAKADAVAVAARRRAEFAAQLAAVYSFDNDETWRQAYQSAKAATNRAREEIAARAKELGIPQRFAPELGLHWYGRGENASRERRAELTRVAHTKIEQLEKEAKHAIERASVEIQTRLVADGLESADAKAFLESMPAPEQLIPEISVAEVQKVIGGRREAE